MTGKLRSARLLLTELGTPSLQPWRHLFRDDRPVPPGRLRAVFRGVSTVLLDDGDTAALTDGFFSRPNIVSTLARPIRPDARRISAALHRAGITQLAAVFVAHSHFDHALDAPRVAARTGAQLLGSEPTAQIAAGYDFPAHRMTVVTPGRPLQFGVSTTSWNPRNVDASSNAHVGHHQRVPVRAPHPPRRAGQQLPAPPGRQGSFATVRRTAESSRASRLCRASGTISRSPERPSHDSSPLRSRTRPRSTCTVASPGFSCSARAAPLIMAMTVCRSTFSWPPMTVVAARPLLLPPRARSSSSRAVASRENFCMAPS